MNLSFINLLKIDKLIVIFDKEISTYSFINDFFNDNILNIISGNLSNSKY